MCTGSTASGISGIIFCTKEGYEADDLLGTLSNRASSSGFDTIIVTSDLDILQLVNPATEVEVFSQYWPIRHFDIESTVKRFHCLSP